MTWYEVLIIIAACAVVIGVIAASVVRKKHGKTGCGCDCGGCPGCAGCSACRSAADKETKQHTQQSP